MADARPPHAKMHVANADVQLDATIAVHTEPLVVNASRPVASSTGNVNPLSPARRRERVNHMRILVAGASGFIGGALVASLVADGHHVVRVGRPSSTGVDATIDVTRRSLDLLGAAREIGEFDVVYQLLGAPLLPIRWGPKRLESIRASRIATTDILARAIAQSSSTPTLVVGCAVGYYGLRGGEELDERSNPGSGTVADICRAWEAAAEPAQAAGSRVVLARSGVVLGLEGLLMQLQLPVFRAGLGARLADGKQWMSWIALQDEVRALRFIADTASISGPVNLVAPNPVTNAAFSHELAAALHKRARLSVPKAVLLAMAGKTTTEEFLLASQRVAPHALQAAGFDFDFPTIDGALEALVRRKRS